MADDTKAAELLKELDVFLSQKPGGVSTIISVEILRGSGGVYNVRSDGFPNKGEGHSLGEALSRFLSD